MKKLSTALLAVIAVGASQLSANDKIYTMADFFKGGRLYNVEMDSHGDTQIANSFIDVNPLLSKSQTITILEDPKAEISQEEAASYKEAFRTGASYFAAAAGVVGAYYFGVPMVFWGVYEGTMLGLKLIGITGFSAMSGATNLAIMAGSSATVKTLLMAGCGAAAKVGTSLIFNAADLVGKAAAGTYKLVGDYFADDKSARPPAKVTAPMIELSKEEVRQKRLLKFDPKAVMQEPKVNDEKQNVVAPRVETLMDKTVETAKSIAKGAWSYLGNAYTALTEKLAPKSEQASV